MKLLNCCHGIILVFRASDMFLAFVTQVHGESLREDKECLWDARPNMVHATRRLLEKAERDRLAQSRLVAVPGKGYSFIFVVLVWAFSSWLCTATTRKGLQYFYHHLHSSLLLHGISQCFTLWLLYSLVGIFKRIFRLSEDSTSMTVVSCCTEYIHRTISAKLGMPTPYDQEITRLRGTCKSQYREWKLRIARREFKAALKRKRITNRESVLLLTEFAEHYYETANEEVVKGELPFELSEAEAFLKLQVEEQASYTETTTLSPDEALQNYLTVGEGHDNRSSLDSLSELTLMVRECVQFKEGDRIVVKFDKTDECDETHDKADTDENKSDSVATFPTCPCCRARRRGQQTASVVFSTATLCYVHFDGESALIPFPVPIHLCSLLDERSLPALGNSNETALLAGEDESSSGDAASSDDESEDDDLSIHLVISDDEEEMISQYHRLRNEHEQSKKL